MFVELSSNCINVRANSRENVYHLKFSSDGTQLYSFTTKDFKKKNLIFSNLDSQVASSLFSFKLEKLIRHEYMEAIDNTQFLKDLKDFREKQGIENTCSGGSIIGMDSNDLFHISQCYTPPIWAFTVDSKQTIDAHLSKEEYTNLPFMERVEYRLRNKVVRSWEYKIIDGGGFILYKLSSSGEILWNKYYQSSSYDNENGGINLIKILPSTSNEVANVFGYCIENDSKNIKKYQLFHFRLNTLDGTIEKSHSFYADFVDDIFRIQRNEEEVFYFSFGGSTFLAVNFEEVKEETFSLHRILFYPFDSKVKDIFWSENKVFFSISMKNSDSNSPLFSEYYFDENEKKMKQKFLSFSNFFPETANEETNYIFDSRRKLGEKKGYIHRYWVFSKDYRTQHHVLLSVNEFGENERCGIYLSNGDDHANVKSEFEVIEIPLEDERILVDEDKKIINRLEVVDSDTIISSEEKDASESVIVRDVDQISSSLEYIDYCDKPQQSVWAKVIVFLLFRGFCVCLFVLLCVVLRNMMKRKRMKKGEEEIFHKEVFDSESNTNSLGSDDFKTSESESDI